MAKLHIVPTPIGNLEDMSFRAVRILKEADFILAEDTRVSAKLLQHYGIDTPCYSYHQHNEHKCLEGFVERIQSGKSAALISDAGTPGVSDPGFLIVRRCAELDIDTECLPGCTAFVPALVNSGLPCDRFLFEGFLPQKKGRNTKLSALALEERTLIFYESPHRLVKTLEQFIEFFGENRQACVCRELSKIYEETRRGKLKELYEYYQKEGVKGEIVLLVQGLDQKTHTYLYPRPAVTTDIAMLCLYQSETYVLLIQRKNPPFKNCYALPGGFVDETENLERCAQRELAEETGLRLKDYQLKLQAFTAYSEPDRDPRGRTITMVYYSFFECDKLPEVEGKDDALCAQWHKISQLPKMAFDHAKIMEDLCKQLLV